MMAARTATRTDPCLALLPPSAATIRAVLIGHWFTWLDRARIAWVAVGDDQALAAGAGSDVDLLVAPHQLGAIPRLVRRFAQAHGLRLVQDIQHEAVARFFVLAWEGDDGRPGFLYLDIAGDYWRRARRFLTAAPLLRRRVHASTVCAAGCRLRYWRPAPADNVLYYLLKKLDKGTLPASACVMLTREWRCDPDGARAALVGYLPAAAVDLVAIAALSGDWDAVQSELPRLRAQLAISPRLGQPSIIAEAVRRLLRCCRPTGLAVQVDGTATADAVARDWAQAFRRVVVVPAGDCPPDLLHRVLLIWPQLMATTLVVFSSTAAAVPGAVRLGASPRLRNRALGLHLARRQAAGSSGHYLC